MSRDGVAFVPVEKTGKDKFTLTYGDFLHTLADSRLIIKSNARIYRFRAVAVAGKNDNGSELHNVAERLARLR